MGPSTGAVKPPLHPLLQALTPPSCPRLTGAALQVTCQQRAAGSLHVLSSEVSFGMLEILECLWASASPERKQQKPEYTEVRSGERMAEPHPGLGAGVMALRPSSLLT